LEHIILHNDDSKPTPLPLIAYIYRKEFGLSYEEFIREPLDKIMTNIKIMELYKKREKREMQRQELNNTNNGIDE